ncbi:hypothetical protein GHT06_008377 [Daphnia sinensis]|uniref:Regulator of G-protein signaling n=1 Tax=Daphnia sinensis TaxID=1820382 RepID=A0AAD5L1A5_9CRUS|nr:hypothetical protein GHT06_008377 [Daphnia sinensis]
MHASRRQKKARARPFSPPVTSHLQASPAYKVAKLVRGQQGFGFTISGQAPCILSCVVPNSSADKAGLHAGDCLLAVNGCDVSRAPHDEVVRLVGSCMGMLRLHLAESGIPATAKGYSSSDEESDPKMRVSSKIRLPRTRQANRMKRKGATPPSRNERTVRDLHSRMMPVPPMPNHSSGTKNRRRRNSSDSSQEHIGNLMSSPNLHSRMNKNNGVAANVTGQLMYRSVVGYLGTIEMPEDSSSQSSPSSGVSGGGLSASGSHSNSNNSAAARLAAIRSCVRRLRIEKKVHTLVLLRVWGPRPGAGVVAGAAGGAASNSTSRNNNSSSSSGKITLTSPAGANLARFPARRVVFCGAYADDARFFGLVTSASHDSDDDDEEDDQSTSDQEEKMLNAHRKNSAAGFTSCHVFMVDSRLVAHEGHAARAHAFRFQCTPAAGGDGRCLEFPPTAEPILQAVLSLCASSGCHGNNAIGLMGWANPLLQQQQQQQQQRLQHQQQQHNLSSHSSSSSSNSDSGIFRDRDDGKNSDRDVQLRHQQDQPMLHHQPISLPLNGNLDRLTVRAMPDPLMAMKSPGELEHAARLRSSMQRYLNQQQQQQPQPAMLLLNRNTGTHQHVNPSLSVRATMTLEEKLSPQVFKGRPGGLPHPTNRPARTPSERSRARSLDDLSKSCQQQARMPGDPPHHQHPHHHHPQQLGSDNGLDKIDWDDSTPFDPVVGWHSLAGQSSSGSPPRQNLLSKRLDYEDDDSEEEEESEPPASDQRCGQDVRPGPTVAANATTASNTSESVLTGTLEKPIQPDQPPPSQPQQHVWTQGFEKLLEDPLGLRAFAGFLKKEFSHENIYFWAACERFHRLFPTEDTTTAAYEAQKIFERHLGPAASEPVNVDSQARQKAEDNLCQPSPELFDQAQKQVFNLMKYDCYPRFLRSPLYRECVQALQQNEQPPIAALTLNDPDLNVDYDFGDNDSDSTRNLALKKSGSDAGERRRRSLLPWPKKDRSKSKDRGDFDYRKTAKKKNRQGSTSSGPEKEKENATDDEDQLIKRAASKDSVASEFSDRAFHIQSTASTVPLVKVLLPDMSSAVIAARPGQSVQQLLSKLLERRGLRFNAFELFDSHHSTSIELERDASAVGGMEIRLEPRVVFHLLLQQSGKSLMIRGQPRRQLGEVLKPILFKYGLKIEHSIITKSATGDVVQTKTLLASLDGCHLKVINREDAPEDVGEMDRDGSGRAQEQAEQCDEPEDLPVKNSGSLLGRKGLNRRNSLQAERNRTVSGKKQSMVPTKSEGTIQNPNISVANKRLSLHDLPKSSSATHLMPPPRAPFGSRKPNTQRNPLTRLENEALYERLKRAQRCRLEDQRGTEINYELPDFLKLPGRCSNDDYPESHELPLDGRASEPIGCRPRRVYQESYEFPLDGRASEPLFSRREVVSEPRSNGSGMSGSCASPDFAAIAAQILDKSFSADGLMPTHEEAEMYFGSSTPSGTIDLKPNQPSNAKITVAAAKQNVANVAARIAAIEQKDRAKQNASQQVSKSNSNSNWDDLLLDLDVDWRCYQGRETDDQKQQLQQHSRPRNGSSSQQPLNSRPPLPTPPALEMLDLDDPLTVASPASPPPLPPKPGKTKINEPFKAPVPKPMPPPRPPSRNINTSSRVNVSFV